MLKLACGMAYVASSRSKMNRALRTCIAGHCSTIGTGDIKSPVARHFVETNILWPQYDI